MDADDPAAVPGPASPNETAPDPIPLSALQHAVYCLRQAALIHLERMWAENRFTAEGHVLHIAADRPGHRRIKGVRRVSALPLASARLGIAGVADLVEFHAGNEAGSDIETAYPVEFKRGKAKLHRADEVQLCAQGLCLEEMTGAPVPEGALFYGETKRRGAVPFTPELRALTEETVAALREVFSTGVTPPPTPLISRCRACSLAELCRPKAVARPAAAFRRRMVETLSHESPAQP
ncbi:MAG TPA: CRISPR-associated protein Cas4 [Aurantimonas coralicida]|uniref:CRISPR-associated exonuclease Cas4 n=2 Tax=root TaxID=1 RepID=A0A9C9NH28_9HYPH|nr:CRISPR-associated protein Cas4 [Aurantimonas coralicida]HEU01581.1 CRISPR-associated protein Cas4 [Aurantimonas coralicida]